MNDIVQFDEAWARRITERIRYTAIAVRDGVDKMQRLVAEAQDGNAHTLLGYASWTAYIADVMGDEPLQLRDREERREVVAWLSGQGMSTRAIAPIVGVTNETVAQDIKKAAVRDLTPEPESGDDTPADPETGGDMDDWAESTSEEFETITRVDVESGAPEPEKITGLDGKTYTRPAPKPERRKSLVDDARNAGWQLRKAIERLERIKNDDRFTRNKVEIEDALRPHLDFATEVLADLATFRTE